MVEAKFRVESGVRLGDCFSPEKIDWRMKDIAGLKRTYSGFEDGIPRLTR